jgi:hypothetical protein
LDEDAIEDFVPGRNSVLGTWMDPLVNPAMVTPGYRDGFKPTHEVVMTWGFFSIGFTTLRMNLSQ